jgi:hypothetical protein
MKRRVLLAAVGALLLAGAYFVVTRAGLIREAAELVRQGGETPLREVLRPPRGGPRVVVVALDGVGRGALYGAIGRGDMPRLAGLMGVAAAGGDGVHEHAWAAPDVLSILPSTTMAAWASVFTGEPPARTGVPGNEWFEREAMRFWAPAPVSVSGHEHTLAMLTDGLVGNRIAVPTLFERADVRSYVSLLPVYRGADLFTLPDPDLVVELFGAVARGIADDEPLEREAYARVDVAAVDNVLETIGRHGLADLQVVYFPGVDLFTHGATDPLEQQARYLAEIVDPEIGRILDAYARLGALDSTYLVIVSDHGHTPVVNDDRHALEPEGGGEPSTVLAEVGFRARPLVLDPAEDEQDYQSAIAYQGAIAYVYLADRSTCPEPGERCDWGRPPRLEEDVLPVVRAFDAANRGGEIVPELRGTLDLILVRSATPDGETVVEVFEEGRLVPLADHLARRPRPDLVRFEERLEGLVDGPFGDRSGDVLLLARSGEGRPLEGRYYFSRLYRSWHGSPHAQDSEIPLIVAREATSGEEIRDLARPAFGDAPSQLGFTPLVLALLGR